MTTTAVITSTTTNLLVQFSGDLVYGGAEISTPQRNIQSITKGDFVNLNRFQDFALSFSVSNPVAVMVTSVNGVVPENDGELFSLMLACLT